MHESLGELIRRARMQLGVEQSDLARRLGVGQQTVSRWERDLSRPRLAVLAQLARALNLSESQLLPAGGYESAVGLADSPPTRTLLPELPFHLLSAQQFESFSADLARHLFRGAEAFAERRPGLPAGRCRRHRPDVVGNRDRRHPVQAGQGVRTSEGAGGRQRYADQG